ELHIRKLPIFRDLTPQELEEVRQGVELVSYDPGDLVCDEHERSDCMYIVRQGLVKVMKNVSSLLGPSDVVDWVAFGDGLRKGAGLPANTPVGKFWSLVPDRARTVLQNATDLSKLGPADRTEVVYGVNDALSSHRDPAGPKEK